MLRTASSLPLYRAFDAGLRPGPFPDQAASLLPGLLAATRTGLSPAGDDELTNSKIRCYVTASPPTLLGARKIEARRLDVEAELDYVALPINITTTMVSADRAG